MDTQKVIFSNTERIRETEGFGYIDGDDWIPVIPSNDDQVKRAALNLEISEKAVQAIAESLDLLRDDIAELVHKDLADIWKKVNGDEL